MDGNNVKKDDEYGQFSCGIYSSSAAAGLLWKVGSAIARFNIVSREIIYHLFKIYSSYFYGIELYETYRTFHNVSVGYHKVVKRIAGLYTRDSNNLACESVGVNIFKHLQAKRIFNIYLWITKYENKSMKSFKYYFCYKSFIRNIAKIFFND